MTLIQLHLFTNLSPPLISLATLSSFPPGEAKGRLQELTPFDVPLSSIHQREVKTYVSLDWIAVPTGYVQKFMPLRKKPVRYGGKVMPN